MKLKGGSVNVAECSSEVYYELRSRNILETWKAITFVVKVGSANFRIFQQNRSTGANRGASVAR